MFTFTRNWFLGIAAAGALALTVASIPAFADELSLNLGAGWTERATSLRRLAASASSPPLTRQMAVTAI